MCKVARMNGVSELQIFVHIPHCGKHLVQLVPKDITMGALIKKCLAKAGVADQVG